MKTIISLSSILIISLTLSSQWVQIRHNNFTYHFAISFLNQSTGWIGGSDSGYACVYYTSNGGNPKTVLNQRLYQDGIFKY